MAVDEQLVNVRTVSGIDWADDSRISNPGSYFILQNLWSKNTSGLVAKRPGSTLVADGRAVITLSGATSTSPLGSVQAGGTPTAVITAVNTNPPVLPAATITVSNFVGSYSFPTSGQIYVVGFIQTSGSNTPQLVSYTGISVVNSTSFQFTGCTGGTGTLVGNSFGGAYVVAVTPVNLANLPVSTNQNNLPTGVGTTIAASGGSIVSTVALAAVTSLITNPKLLGVKGMVPKVNL